MPLDRTWRFRNGKVAAGAVKAPKNKYFVKLPCFRSISSRTAKSFYRKFQLLHVRMGRSATNRTGKSDIFDLYKKYPRIIDSTWSIENPGSVTKSELSPQVIFGDENALREITNSWYASFIFQSPNKSTGNNIVDDFLTSAPLDTPPFMKDAFYEKDSTSLWMFFGQNLSPPCDSNMANSSANSPVVAGLRGRTEHTDSLEHSGTWHYQVLIKQENSTNLFLFKYRISFAYFQVCGEKIWHVRPQEAMADWGSCAPILKYKRKPLRNMVSKLSTNNSKNQKRKLEKAEL